MSMLLRQSTTITLRLGPALDKTDGVTEEIALSPTVEISKAGGAFVARNSATAITHDSNGWYAVELNATDTNTLGILMAKFDDSATHLPVWHEFMVVPANVYDSFVAGTDTLQSDLTQIGGVAQSATDLKDFADAGYDPITNKVQGLVLCDTVTTLTGHTAQTADHTANISAILTDTAEIGTAGAGLTDLGGMSTTMKGQINAEVDNALDTAIPGIPTSNSINERIKAIDDKLPPGTISDFDEASNNVTLASATHTGAVIPTVTNVTNLHASSATLANQTTILNRIGDFAGSGLNTMKGFFQALFRKDSGVSGANLPSEINEIENTVTGTYDASTDSVEAIRDTAPLGTSMRGTDSAALASVCTEARLSELDAATSGKMANQVDVIEADTTALNNTKIPDTLSLANINAEVDNALDTVLPASPTAGSINDILDRQEELLVKGTAQTGTLSTTQMTTDLTVSVTDQFNGRLLTFRKDTVTVALRGQQTDITGTSTIGGKLTFTALTTAPANGDVFDIT